MTSRVRAVVLRGPAWESGRLLVAIGRRQRRRGLIPAPGPYGLLLRTRSVHGWGMLTPLRWVGLDQRGTVVATGVLARRRVVVAPPGVCWMVELPVTHPVPALGARLRVVPILAGWRDD